jgi:pyruvate-formate lyase-activating enzyme
LTLVVLATRRLPLLPGPSPVAVHPRPPRSVRLSLTDRCDLACVYCRPHRHDGYLEERLEDSAWKAMIEGLVRAGVRRVRLTGGEPLLHPRAVELVAFLKQLEIEDLALTTNATRLASLAAPLRRAGLRRITISLDSLIPERFFQLTRGGHLGRVLDGIEAALAAGFDEVKINTVVLRGRNDDEIEALTRWSWDRGITPRFIELMKIGEGASLPESALVTAREMQLQLAHLLADGIAAPDPDPGPRLLPPRPPRPRKARRLHLRHQRHLLRALRSAPGRLGRRAAPLPRHQRRRRRRRLGPAPGTPPPSSAPSPTPGPSSPTAAPGRAAPRTPPPRCPCAPSAADPCHLCS